MSSLPRLLLAMPEPATLPSPESVIPGAPGIPVRPVLPALPPILF